MKKIFNFLFLLFVKYSHSRKGGAVSYLILEINQNDGSLRIRKPKI